MKSKKEVFTELSKDELAMSFVFRTKQSIGAKKKDSNAIGDLKMAKVSHPTEIKEIISALLRFRFKIEDYLNSEEFDQNLTFSACLKEYIKLIHKKQKEFASDINMQQTELSQIINKHRKPPHGFVVRLEIHSSGAIPAQYWNKILNKENEFELLNDPAVWATESKNVIRKLPLNV